MSKLRLYGSTSGYNELTVPAVADNSEVNILDIAGKAKMYANTSEVPQSGVANGSIVFVESNNRMYLRSGGFWLSAALFNLAPSISNVSSFSIYPLDTSNTIITPVVTDPEGFSFTPTFTFDPDPLTSLSSVSGVTTNGGVLTIEHANTAGVETANITVTASDGINTVNTVIEYMFNSAAYQGALFTTTGSHTVTVGQDPVNTANVSIYEGNVDLPPGPIYVSGVCVGAGGGSFGPYKPGGGGGALAYRNGITVNTGDTFTVYVGAGVNNGTGQSSYITWPDAATTTAGGGLGGNNGRTGGAPSGTYDGGGNGGTGGDNGNAGGGGAAGAGGYSGNGGNGGSTGSAGSGGGGGGGQHGTSARAGGGGGGVGMYGEGSNGAGGTGGNFSTTGGAGGGGAGGGGGSSGGDGDNGYTEGATGGAGGLYGGGRGGGGGHGGSPAGSTPMPGQQGAVRLMFSFISGTRSFPSANTAESGAYSFGETEKII